MTDAVLGGSFRDPAGFVFTRGGQLYRQVNLRYKPHYDLLFSSGLYEALTSQDLLIPHTEVDVEPARSVDAYRILRPEPIDFVSYPYEWSFSQLKDAALLTLRVQEIALEHGMSLQDASAYNVQFRSGRPILIDTLSFETLREGEPWSAYGQFCRHFLAPLALMAYRDPRLAQLMRVHIDGIPLDLTDRLLPNRARYRPSLFLHIHAHAKQRGTAKRETRTRSFGRRAFEGLISSLRGAVRKLERDPTSTPWSDYYKQATHYTDEAMEDKTRLVESALDRAAPGTVWDMGANTGLFSRLAAKRGISTISFDLDHDSVDAHYRRALEEGETNVLPLLCDLRNPSPSLGWAHTERSSLVERGPADVVLALALVHHLAIGNNVPLDEIARFFRLIGRWLLVEFVPKSDPKVEVLMSVRDDIFDGYDAPGFERAFEAWFDIVEKSPLRGSQRLLYLLHARDDVSPPAR